MNRHAFTRDDRAPFRVASPVALAAAGFIAAFAAAGAGYFVFGPHSDARALQMAGVRPAAGPAGEARPERLAAVTVPVRVRGPHDER